MRGMEDVDGVTGVAGVVLIIDKARDLIRPGAVDHCHVVGTHRVGAGRVVGGLGVLGEVEAGVVELLSQPEPLAHRLDGHPVDVVDGCGVGEGGEGSARCTPKMLRDLALDLPGLDLIACHFGGYRLLDEAEDEARAHGLEGDVATQPGGAW